MKTTAAAKEAALEKAALAQSNALKAFDKISQAFLDLHRDAPTTSIKSSNAADKVAKAAAKVTSTQRALENAYAVYNKEA